MANVVGRRPFSKTLFRLIEYSRIFKQVRCTGLLFMHNGYSGIFETYKYSHQPFVSPLINSQVQLYSTKSSDSENENDKKLSLFRKFKQMYKNYWYVLVPVHLITSAAWFGGFYYLAKSGVDIVSILESWHVSDRIINPLRDSSMGYLAVSYALYKIATPARYTVTLGGTTVSINYLTKWGYIKPVPSKERLKEMYYEQKDNLLETMRETKEGLKVHSEKLKDKKENIIDDFDKGIKQIKELGDKTKEQVAEELKKKVNKTDKN